MTRWFATLLRSRFRRGAAITAVLGSVLAVTTISSGGVATANSMLPSVLAMLALRSPGERAAGELVDTKPGHARAAPKSIGPARAGPHEHALGKIFPAEPVPDQTASSDFSPPFQPDVLNDAPAASTISNLPAGGGGPGGGEFDPPGGGGPAGGGGGGGSPGNNDPGNPGGDGPGGGGPTTPVAAVPELDTWLMLIVAFGLCGSLLRRQRALESSDRACVPSA